MAVLKTICVALLLHGIFTVTLPYVILHGAAQLHWTQFGQFDFGLSIVGWLLIASGASVYIRACYELLSLSATSATPLDEPDRLRTKGLYSRSRNPLLLGVVAILMGEAFTFQSFALLGYALLYWGWLTVFVTFAEEPTMRRKFGGTYDSYCDRVPRWFIPLRSKRG